MTTPTSEPKITVTDVALVSGAVLHLEGDRAGIIRALNTNGPFVLHTFSLIRSGWHPGIYEPLSLSGSQIAWIGNDHEFTVQAAPGSGGAAGPTEEISLG